MSQCPRLPHRRHSSPAAFTLVELLVVIGIIGLLISILLPTLGAAREQAKTTQCASNMRQLAVALVNYSTENKGKFPPNIGTLLPTTAIPPGAPSANLWYDVDRIGRYLPKGVQPSATSTNPTIGGTVLKCPGDYDQAQRSYAMNIWASSMVDQFVLDYTPEVRTYAGGTYNAKPARARFWSGSTKGASQLMLMLEAHGRNTVPAGFYANSTVGLVTSTANDVHPGLKFLGLQGYTVGFDNFGGGVYPAWQANTQVAWFKHRAKKDRSRPASQAVGRMNIGFADGHVELMAHDDVADPITKRSRLRALWSPLDGQLNTN